jgi:leucyl aminopeptidase
MNAILAVGKGSVNKPRMIILNTPQRAGRKIPLRLHWLARRLLSTPGHKFKARRRYARNENGYDRRRSGIDDNADYRKIETAIECLRIICAAENRPDATSYLPGDIITTYSGKTIEVLNTDAEGRVVLSDGLEQARRLGCKNAVDIATLTGACVVALGKSRGVFSVMMISSPKDSKPPQLIRMSRYGRCLTVRNISTRLKAKLQI